MRIARNAGLALCIAGILLAGYGLYDGFSGRIYQAWRGRQVDRELDGLPQPSAVAAKHTITYTPGSAIGRLEIPRLKLSVVVLEGSDDQTLRLGVGRLRNSSLPGEDGNVVLAAHRDTFFRPLREIRPGDRISLRTSQGSFAYTVDWTKVVNPTDIDVIQPTPAPSLTLVTCYPFYYVGSAPQRFIVRAAPASATAVVSPAAPVAIAPASVAPAPSLHPRKPRQVRREPDDVAVGQPVAESPKPVAAPPPPAPQKPASHAKPNFEMASASVDPLAPKTNVTAAVPTTEPQADSQTPSPKGPIKAALHKIVGVFKPHRAKLQ